MRSWIRGHPTFVRLFYFALGRLFLRERWVKRRLKSLLAQKASDIQILDAGCGFGQYSYYLAKHYPDIIILAVDNDPRLVEDFALFLGKSNYDNLAVDDVDLRKIAYKNWFNLILSVDVMEHIEQDELVLRNFFRALKPGGVLVLHTPHIGSFSGSSQGAFVGEHFRDGYSREEIVEKLQRAGFGRIEHIYTYGKSGAIAWRLLQKYPLTLLRLSILLFPLFALYYLIIYLPTEILMALDLRGKNSNGEGILLMAWK